jgi:proteic killer suppression protein
MIESFRSPGLKELFETGKSRKVRQDLIARALRRLDALESAPNLGSLNQPGFDFHPLTNTKPPQRYSIHVNGPWCITFEWEEGKARRVDLEQYH